MWSFNETKSSLINSSNISHESDGVFNPHYFPKRVISELSIASKGEEKLLQREGNDILKKIINSKKIVWALIENNQVQTVFSTLSADIFPSEELRFKLKNVTSNSELGAQISSLIPKNTVYFIRGGAYTSEAIRGRNLYSWGSEKIENYVREQSDQNPDINHISLSTSRVRSAENPYEILEPEAGPFQKVLLRDQGAALLYLDESGKVYPDPINFPQNLEQYSAGTKKFAALVIYSLMCHGQNHWETSAAPVRAILNAPTVDHPYPSRLISISLSGLEDFRRMLETIESDSDIFLDKTHTQINPRIAEAFLDLYKF